MEHNYKIPQFFLFFLHNCNNGKAWVSPFKYAVDDILNIHGLLDRSTNLDSFKTDWNKVMILVDKIEQKGYEVSIRGNSVTIVSKSSETPYFQPHEVENEKILSVFNACMIFIDKSLTGEITIQKKGKAKLEMQH